MNYRRKANIVLGSVFLIFIAAAWLRHLWPNHQGIYFFFFVSEASLVGGLADWFAVTALFRKPLGWPYHTALIPRNRDKLITGVSKMVQEELLGEALIRKKIEGFQLSPWLIRQVDRAGGTSYLNGNLNNLIKNLLGRIPADKLAAEIERILKEKLIDSGISKGALQTVRLLLESKELDQWLDGRVEDGVKLAAQPVVKNVLLRSLEQIQEEQAGNGGKLQRTLLGIFQATDGLNLDEAAEALQIELILHVRELEDLNHPLRGHLKEVFRERLLEWERDVDVLNAIEQWKNALIRETKLDVVLIPVLEQMLSKLREGRLPDGQTVEEFLMPILTQWWPEFKGNTHLQAMLDKLAQDFLVYLLQSEHSVVGQVVQETLAELSDEELNRFIEDKAGNDLQWIRINGSLVGGIIGAMLFVVLHYGYEPLIGFLR